jgi:hypothetical protein
LQFYSATAAAVLSWLYTVFLLVMEVSETCTIGGDGHLPTFMIGGPAVLIAVVLLYLSNRENNSPIGSRLVLTPAVVVLLIYHLPQAPFSHDPQPS